MVYRRDARRVFATLVRLLGDFDLAEEALHDAFRRQARFTSTETLAQPVEAIADESLPADAAGELGDDSLRLIFTCCHPALAPDAQVAQRIVRAKAKIRDAKIPYRVPEADELPQRVDSVLRVLYLVFNEGYPPSSGALLTRADLSGEAIRLTRLIAEVLPPPPLAEGCALVEKALHMPGIGPYALQAAISAVHAQGLALVDEILQFPAMQNYHLARTSYQAALALTQLEPERRFLQRRLAELAG